MSVQNKAHTVYLKLARCRMSQKSMIFESSARSHSGYTAGVPSLAESPNTACVLAEDEIAKELT